MAVWREGDAAVAAIACAGISRELEALRSREIADGSERRARAIAVAAWRIAESTPAAALDTLKILRSLAGDQFEIADDAALDERRRQRVRAKMLMKEPPPPPLDAHAAYPRPMLGASAYDDFLVFTEDPVSLASVNTKKEEVGQAGGTTREVAVSSGRAEGEDEGEGEDEDEGEDEGEGEDGGGGDGPSGSTA